MLGEVLPEKIIASCEQRFCYLGTKLLCDVSINFAERSARTCLA